MFVKNSLRKMIALLALAIFMTACGVTDEPFVVRTFTPSPTTTPTSTDKPPTATRTASPTLRPSGTPFPTFTIVPSLTPFPTNTPTPPILGVGQFYGVLRDDFSDKNSGWVEEGTEDYGFGYSGESYAIYSRIGNGEVTASRTRGHTDFIVQADVTLLAGSLDTYFGVTCRKTHENYIVMAVNGKGGYVISKTTGGSIKELTSGFSSAIRSGLNVTNRIRASCVGNVFSLEVNGTAVVSILDVAPTFGSQVGFVVGTYEEGDVRVLFDNFDSFPPEGSDPAPTFTPEGFGLTVTATATATPTP